MPAFFRFRLRPNEEYGYDVLSWVGIPPPDTSYRMVADITIDRTYNASPGFPVGAMEYQYPFAYVTEDTTPDAAFSLWWLIYQYVNELNEALPVSWKLLFGPLPETPVLTEMFEIAVRIDGISQSGISISSATSDGVVSIMFDTPGFLPNQTYRVSVYGDTIDIGEPEPGGPETAFWTQLIGSKEVI